MDRRAWWATIHRVPKSWTQLNELNNNHKGPREVKLLSCVQLFVTPWTVAYEAPPSMGFPMQEYWSGLLFPFPGDLPNPGIEPMSLRSPALIGGFFTTSTTWEFSEYVFHFFL